MFGVYGGKKRMLRFGRKGMADILAIHSRLEGYFTTDNNPVMDTIHTPIWIEVKRPGGKQTPDQIAFQSEVEAEGHRYLLVTSWEEVMEALK
jgi:hypothetical protein